MKNAEAYAKQQSVHFELHEKIPTIEIWWALKPKQISNRNGHWLRVAKDDWDVRNLLYPLTFNIENTVYIPDSSQRQV